MCSADADLVNIGSPQPYNAAVKHGIATDEEDNISGEEAVPDANQTSALDNTPVDYAEYDNDIYDGDTDYDDNYADEAPLPPRQSAGGSEDPDEQLLQETRSRPRETALEEAVIALSNVCQERCTCSMYTTAISAIAYSNSLIQPSQIAL